MSRALSAGERGVSSGPRRFGELGVGRGVNGTGRGGPERLDKGRRARLLLRPGTQKAGNLNAACGSTLTLIGTQTPRPNRNDPRAGIWQPLSVLILTTPAF